MIANAFDEKIICQRCERVFINSRKAIAAIIGDIVGFF